VSLLTKTCPKCKGAGKIRNTVLPGRRVCRRCGGRGWLQTMWGRLAEAAERRLKEQFSDDDQED